MSNTSLTKEEIETINSMSYEQARDQLAITVQKLENGGLDLEQSVRQWELGEALAQRAQSLLEDIRKRFEAVQANQQSTASSAGTQDNL